MFARIARLKFWNQNPDGLGKGETLLNKFPNCSTRYTAAHNSGARVIQDVRYIVIHTTEGETAEGAASWFANPVSEGSSNVVVSDDICYRVMDDLTIPWAAPPLNRKGFHIEIAGFAHWTKYDWNKNIQRVQNAAYRAAIRCKEFNIPIQFRNAEDLKAGLAGITTHAEISKAFGQTNHTDPGTAFPMITFLAFVKHYSA